MRRGLVGVSQEGARLIFRHLVFRPTQADHLGVDSVYIQIDVEQGQRPILLRAGVWIGVVEDPAFPKPLRALAILDHRWADVNGKGWELEGPTFHGVLINHHHAKEESVLIQLDNVLRLEGGWGFDFVGHFVCSWWVDDQYLMQASMATFRGLAVVNSSGDPAIEYS